MFRETRDQGFGAEVKRRILLGTYALSAGYYDAYYRKAQQVRTLLTRDFLKAFAKVDAIVSPITPTPAFKLGEKTDDPVQMYLEDIYSVAASLALLCGVSVPCGETQGGIADRGAGDGPALRRGDDAAGCAGDRSRTGHFVTRIGLRVGAPEGRKRGFRADRREDSAKL